ncbi:MAG: type II toxin-antitoxin system RelE/ParE family toxin [Gammaproteobacteria bacterium]|nr:type II toxin-antitoxin system RelE/ParE family toxin [Gammaproteobacteria bacterium]
MTTRKLVEYLDKHGNSQFGRWLSQLHADAAARITTALYRMEQGNFSNTKSVGKGVFEYKIDFGPGYRIYFGHDGNLLVIILNGGTKKQQNSDIKFAQKLWEDYKVRKKEGRD